MSPTPKIPECIHHAEDRYYWLGAFCRGDGFDRHPLLVCCGKLDRRPVSVSGQIEDGKGQHSHATFVLGEERPPPAELARQTWIKLCGSKAKAHVAETKHLRGGFLPFEAHEVVNGYPATAEYWRWLIWKETR